MPNSDPCRCRSASSASHRGTHVRGHVFDVRAVPADAGQGRRRLARVPVPIDDPADPRLADYVELTDPAARRRLERDELFVAEGVTAIARLLTSGHRVRSVLVTPQALRPLRRRPRRPRRARCTSRRKAVLAATVGFDLHRGAVAAADRRPLPALADVAAGAAPRSAVLEGLNDPENLGAVARSARAFGVDGLVLDPHVHRPVLPAHGAGQHGRGAATCPSPGPTAWPDDLAVLARRRLRDVGPDARPATPPTCGRWTSRRASRVLLGAEGPGPVSGRDGRAPTAACASRSPPASTRSTSATPRPWRSPTSSPARRRGDPARPGGTSASSRRLLAPLAICSIVVAIAVAAPSWAMILLITARLAPPISSAWLSWRYCCDARMLRVVPVISGIDVAGEQLPRAQRRLAVGPVVGEAEHDAEAAGRLLQRADHRRPCSSGVPTTAAPAPSAPPPVVALEQLPRVLDGHRAGPARASRRCTRCASGAGRARPRRAPARVSSARWNAISTRQSARSTVEPCCAAASSAKPHCVGRALMPSVELEAIDSTPMPYLPASCMPDGEIDDAVAIGISSCSGQDLQLGVVELEPVALVAEAVLAAQQPDDHAERLVLAVAQQHRVDAVGAGVRRQGAGPGAEHRPAPGHVVELDHPLGDVERVVVRAG